MIDRKEGYFSCDLCFSRVSIERQLHKIRKNGVKIHLCQKCYSNNRRKFRKVSNEEITKENKEAWKFEQERRKQEKIYRNLEEEKLKGKSPIVLDKNNNYIPLRYRKERKQKNNNLRLNLTSDEKTLLFNKYRKQGYEVGECKVKLKRIIDNLRTIIISLRDKSKSEEEIKGKFRKEFLRMVNE